MSHLSRDFEGLPRASVFAPAPALASCVFEAYRARVAVNIALGHPETLPHPLQVPFRSARYRVAGGA